MIALGLKLSSLSYELNKIYNYLMFLESKLMWYIRRYKKYIRQQSKMHKFLES